jgi:hypothetical protein
LTVTLDDGRRTSAEYVPPPAAHQRQQNAEEPASGSAILTQLRNLADPEFSGSQGGMRGGMGSLGVAATTSKAPRYNQAEMVVYQTKVAPLVANSAELTAEATIGTDGMPQLKMTPVFQSAGKAQSMPLITNPLIPGGFESTVR